MAKPGLEMIFGMGPKGKPMGEDAHDEARDMLVSALHDVGIKGEEASALVDALHEYVDACIEKHESGPEEKEEGEEPSDEEY